MPIEGVRKSQPLVVADFKEAIESRKPSTEDLTHHSDRGCQHKEHDELVTVTIKIGHPGAREIMLIWSLESQSHLFGYPLPVASSSVEHRTAGAPMKRVGHMFEFRLAVPKGSRLHFGYWTISDKKCGGRFRWNLGNSQLVKGAEQITVKPNFRQVITSKLVKRYNKQIASFLNRDGLRGYYANFFVNERFDYVFCSIPKNGCSSLKYWFQQTTYPEDPYLDADIHFYMRKHHSLDNKSKAFAKRTLKNRFKFAIVRNPWSRVLSAYLNKFASQEIKPPAYPVIDYVRGKGHAGRYDKFVQVKRVGKGQPRALPGFSMVDYSPRVSFREFIDYLCEFKDDELNVHWRPQWRFLQGVEMDFIGRLENMESDIKTISNKLSIPEIGFPHRNRTPYVQIQSDRPLADVSPKVFVEQGGRPYANQLWTPELIEKVAQRYEKDIRMFGYQNDYPKL